MTERRENVIDVNAQHSVPHDHRDKYAADGGYAARFLGIFLALSFSRFDGEATLATHRK